MDVTSVFFCGRVNLEIENSGICRSFSYFWGLNNNTHYGIKVPRKDKGCL
jgi:hypothetical protein